MSPAARKIAASWDPARDEAAGEQCRGYGIGGVMRLPGRLRITWQDDRTLKIETEAGSQVRTLAFAGGAVAPATGGDWQGVSRASWDRQEGPMGSGAIFGGGGFGAGRASGGSLKVVTTGMKSGYLRKNGVPYSANAVITEYFDRFDLDGGDVLLVVATETVDPTYLSQPYWTSTHYKRQANATDGTPPPARHDSHDSEGAVVTIAASTGRHSCGRSAGRRTNTGTGPSRCATTNGAGTVAGD